MLHYPTFASGRFDRTSDGKKWLNVLNVFRSYGCFCHRLI